MRSKRIPAEEQYRLIMECRQSGLTDHQWCVEHDIKPGTFYNWVKRLRQKGCVDLPASTGRTYRAPESQEVVRVDFHDTDPLPYEQPLRRAGKTSNNFYRLYDAAMLSITSYTKAGLRLATIFGSICSAVSMIVAIVYLVLKLVYWDRFAAGMAPLLIGMCFLGSVQIFFIGLVGEYILTINARVMKRPLVVEEERINFEENE